MDKRRLGLSMILAASVIRGFQGFFVRATQWTANHTIPLAFFRLFIPAFVVYIFRLASGKKIEGIFLREKWPVHVTALFTAIRMTFFFLGYAYADLSSAAIVFFSSGIFLTLLEPLIFGEKLSGRIILSAIIGFFGVAVVFSDQTVSLKNAQFIGLVFMSVASALVIVENILKKKYVQRVSSVDWVFYQGFLGSLVFFPTLFFFPWPTMDVWPWIVLFALAIGLVAFALDMAAFRRVRISELSIARYIEPMASMAVGFLIFHESLTWNKFVGAVLVFSSVYLVFGGKEKR